jgi:hypothetical protein
MSKHKVEKGLFTNLFEGTDTNGVPIPLAKREGAPDVQSFEFTPSGLKRVDAEKPLAVPIAEDGKRDDPTTLPELRGARRA